MASAQRRCYCSEFESTVEGRRASAERSGQPVSRKGSERTGRTCMIFETVALVVLVLLCCISGAAARAPKHIPRFAFDKDESPVNVPLMLQVML